MAASSVTCPRCLDPGLSQQLLRTIPAVLFSPHRRHEQAAQDTRKHIRDLLCQCAQHGHTSSVAVELRHGHIQGLLHKPRGRRPTAGTAAADSLLHSIISEHSSLARRASLQTLPSRRSAAALSRKTCRQRAIPAAKPGRPHDLLACHALSLLVAHCPAARLQAMA